METLEFSWRTSKNIPIYARAWGPDEPVKAVIVLVHGIGEHIGRYEHVAQMFTNNHYGFIGADLVGNGKSGGQRGHADSFDDFLEIIDLLLTETDIRFPGVPKVLYGHSLGGNLILYHAMKRKPSISGLIVSSPGLEVVNVPPLKVAIGKLLYSIYPRFPMTNSLDVSGLSSDPSVVEAYVNDPLVHNMVSVRFGLDLLSVGKWQQENIVTLDVPMLIFHGECDRLVNISGSRKFASQYQGDLTFVEIPGGYHELHNEPNKADLFELMLTWLAEKVLQPASYT
ncbi:MAG: alpha/beta hydrolase [Bellilinea sp.]